MTDRPDGTVAVVVLTYERVAILRQCVENVLARASDKTSEIVIWNNGSTDGTKDYLDSLDDTRIQVVHSPKNIGHNAYDHAFGLTTAPYLLELDDDMIDAPDGWDARLLDAFRALPEFGYLGANLVDNPNDWTAMTMYGKNAHLYHEETINGVKLKLGPTGGGCSLTSRALWEQVGGFGQNRRRTFWEEDGQFIKKLERIGLRAGYLTDLQLLHAGGAYYSPVVEAKEEFWRWRERRHARRTKVKRAILAIPFLPRLNSRFGWFEPPEPRGGAEQA